MATTTKTVTVRMNHRASRPYTVWVTPVGWEPDVSQFGDDAFHDGGAVYESETNQDELAGMAATLADLDTDDPQEDEQYQVWLADLFWLSSGDCRNLGRVELE